MDPIKVVWWANNTFYGSVFLTKPELTLYLKTEKHEMNKLIVRRQIFSQITTWYRAVSTKRLVKKR
jgi:hypothetical protein